MGYGVVKSSRIFPVLIVDRDQMIGFPIGRIAVADRQYFPLLFSLRLEKAPLLSGNCQSCARGYARTCRFLSF